MNKRSCQVLFILTATLGAACGGPQAAPLDELTQRSTGNNGFTLNGFTLNGFSLNGFSLNGLTGNGLSFSGLTATGLTTSEFSSWFLSQSSGPASANMVMRYIVKCAAPAGVTLSAAVQGVAYSWSGELGLAPQWLAGNPIPVVEQQLVTACLGAHVNKFGEHVPISVQGYQSSGAIIPSATHELQDFPVKEGCFFGNLFTDEGLYVGNDSVWSSDKSSSRECAISVSGKANNNCSPMIFAGKCSDICAADGSKNAYYSCVYQGRRYASMNTRIAHEVIYQCGDHICQVSESCGTGKTPDNCKDCGPCQ